MARRWETMSPEERERFRAGMREKDGCGWSREDKQRFRAAIRAKWGRTPTESEPAEKETV
jgi:hypothetical protein